MRVITGLASFLFASFALASPIVNVESRDLCTVGVPCVVQYELNVTVAAVNSAAAMVKADVAAIAAPSKAVIDALDTAVAKLSNVASEVQVQVGALTGDARAQLRAYIRAAIATLVGEVKTGTSIIVSVATSAKVTVAADAQDALDAISEFVAAIEVVIGPCYPATA